MMAMETLKPSLHGMVSLWLTPEKANTDTVLYASVSLEAPRLPGLVWDMTELMNEPLFIRYLRFSALDGRYQSKRLINRKWKGPLRQLIKEKFPLVKVDNYAKARLFSVVLHFRNQSDMILACEWLKAGPFTDTKLRDFVTYCNALSSSSSIQLAEVINI
jgi:hypothetical protein